MKLKIKRHSSKSLIGEPDLDLERASGEAEAIRATGTAKADADHAGVVALGQQGYTALQVMQIIGDRSMLIVPDVAVSGATGGTGLTEGLLGLLMLRSQVEGKGGNGDGGTPKSK